VEKFRKFRFADVGKSELGKKTCAKHKIDRSQNGRSNNVHSYRPDNIYWKDVVSWREKVDNRTNAGTSTNKSHRSLIMTAGFVTAHALNRRCHSDDRCDSSLVRSVGSRSCCRRMCCFLISNASCDAKATPGRTPRLGSPVAASNTDGQEATKACAVIRSAWLASHPNPNRRTQSESNHYSRDWPTRQTVWTVVKYGRNSISLCMVFWQEFSTFRLKERQEQGDDYIWTDAVSEWLRCVSNG